MLHRRDQPSYLGCFIEHPYNPDLTGEPPLIITRAEACFSHCSIGTWSYAAIRNRTICTCGDAYNNYGAAPASACSTPCSEKQSTFDDCGGPEANSIYGVQLTIPKVPFPTPSINSGIYPTPPTHPDGNRSPNDYEGVDDQGSKSSRAALISSAVIAVAVLALGLMSLMVYRKRKNRTSLSLLGHNGKDDRCMDDKARATTGHSWFMMGGSNRRNDCDDEADQPYGSSYRAGQYHSKRAPGAPGDMEAQLFEGFESSVIMEDHQGGTKDGSSNRHQDGRQSIETTSSAGSRIFSHTTHHSVPQQSSSESAPVSAMTAPDDSQKPLSTFTSKIGSKLGHLRVKTLHLQPPHPTSTSSATSQGGLPVMPISPVSPISPISPASASSTTSTMSMGGSSSSQAPGAGLDQYDTMLRIMDNSGNKTSRDPASATPSFSLASAPIPGPASNRQGCSSTTPSNVVSAMPSLERFQSATSSLPPRFSQDYQDRDLYEPLPSPISPSVQYGSLPPLPHGDSVLEDKEMALMAQYQPHHCRQQQQQQQQQQHHAAVASAAQSTTASTQQQYSNHQVHTTGWTCHRPFKIVRQASATNTTAIVNVYFWTCIRIRISCRDE
ncbi:hypothetical protein BC939DRAFT_477947 [Gamsiella multidivaricata]|uniref:uncharacterized protein n=1 Tax=Gamsiella multidivaricata TaxID=101098 RepID=UPI002220CABB|nr:uncharacterized protein BC939DRAFT_477947 [Gamsiella multidivaricata]KAI7822219.1 hypothetical protein BC939DRAFT_477947 [Gamsiella multidivaricata]